MKNLVTATNIQYLLTFIGGILVAKGWIPIEIWDFVSSGLDDLILVLVGGGGVVAAAYAWVRGVRESAKDKVVLNGQRVELPPVVAGTISPSTAKDILIGKVSSR